MEVKADKLYMQLNAAELEAIIKKKGEIPILDQMHTYVHTTVMLSTYIYIYGNSKQNTL